MINSQNLIDKICAKIAGGGLTSLETCQTNGALTILATPVCSVTTKNSLPNALNYQGRMIYVNDENRYYYAIGCYWINNFQSTVFNYIDVSWAWGSNADGRLGASTATTASASSPVSTVGGFSDWCRVSAGQSHSLATRSNGSLWAWGSNGNGQLGNNCNLSTSSPVSVVGGFTDWCQIGAGTCFSLAVRTNGTAWAWGCNQCGQLGDNSTVGKISPVSVVGGFTDWCQVSAGEQHSVGVRTNGTAWAWGSNGNGRLGDNTATSRSSPVSVVGAFTNWCQVSAGCSHSIGVRSAGTAWSWGANFNGRLGDNTAISRSSPVSVVGAFTNWCQVSAGRDHSAGTRTAGSAWTWGCNANGQLGDNSTTSRSSPVSVVGGFADWCVVSAGQHSLGARTNGTAWAWGANDVGQLGDLSTTSRSSPVSVNGGSVDWCSVSAGSAHSLGLRQICKGC